MSSGHSKKKKENENTFLESFTAFLRFFRSSGVSFLGLLSPKLVLVVLFGLREAINIVTVMGRRNKREPRTKFDRPGRYHSLQLLVRQVHSYCSFWVRERIRLAFQFF